MKADSRTFINPRRIEKRRRRRLPTKLWETMVRIQDSFRSAREMVERERKEVKVHRRCTTMSDAHRHSAGGPVNGWPPGLSCERLRVSTRSTGSGWSGVDQNSANLLMVPLVHAHIPRFCVCLFTFLRLLPRNQTCYSGKILNLLSLGFERYLFTIGFLFGIWIL